MKPGNVKIRDDGTVKVLDFGLAKTPSHTDTAPDGSGSVVTSPAMTQLGIVLGTAAYMSPEQAKGRQVNRRADVWAFGVVLYEMLTGKKLFAASDVSETLAAVLTREPDWSVLPDRTPPALRRLVSRCLVKDPRARLDSMGAARLEIDEAIDAPAASPAVPARTSSKLIPAAIAVAALVAGALLGHGCGLHRPAQMDFARPWLRASRLLPKPCRPSRTASRSLRTARRSSTLRAPQTANADCGRGRSTTLARTPFPARMTPSIRSGQPTTVTSGSSQTVR